MIRLSGTQRELMEIIWEAGEITLNGIVRAALGNAVTMNRTDAVRVVLMQMVTKGAVSEDKSVSPHIFRPLVSRDEVGFETSFASGGGEGSALLNMFSSGGLGSLGGLGGSLKSSSPKPAQPDGAKSSKKFSNVNQSEEEQEAVRRMMEQICRERDEYEAEKARKKAEAQPKEEA